MQFLWLFIVRLSSPYKLFMLCNTARVPRGYPPLARQGKKNGEGADPPPPPWQLTFFLHTIPWGFINHHVSHSQELSETISD